MNDSIPTKYCPKCQLEKSISEFTKNKSKKDGLCSYCKQCQKLISKRYNSANVEKNRARCKAYYNANYETIAARTKAYKKAHPEKVAAQRRSYYDIEKATKYKKANAEIIKKKKQAYNQTKIGKGVALKTVHKRRALKMNNLVEDFNPVEVFERDGYICQLCGIKTRPDYKNQFHPKKPNLDHIIPLSRGGEHSRLNTQCLCRHCNMLKHNNGTGDQLRMFG